MWRCGTSPTLLKLKTSIKGAESLFVAEPSVASAKLLADSQACLGLDPRFRGNIRGC